MVSATKTRTAVLGTLAEFHKGAVPYDLAALVNLVAEVHPDLLCLDITPKIWLTRDLSQLPSAYAAALLPLAQQTDIVVVPVGNEHDVDRLDAVGWRAFFANLIRRQIALIQRTAPSPDAANQGWRHDFGNFLYAAMRFVAGPGTTAVYQTQIQALSDAVLTVARANPGDRILVVANIQFCHHIRAILAKEAAITTIDFRHL